MILGLGRGTVRASRSSIVHPMLIAACALTLAACGHNNPANLAATQPRGATVAFDSIDGPPPAQFETLVRNLNDEAQTCRLAVMSRENPSAYRVRGYLAAKVAKGNTTISWVWDVFDRDQNHAFRIAGEERSKGAGKDTGKTARDAWAVADDAMLRRIAHDSIDRLAAFLTSPDAAPDTIPAADQTAFTLPNDSSPEAAGIFRIFHANADPLPASPAASPSTPDDIAGGVSLPPRRPGTSETLAPSELAPAEKVTLAASTL